MNIRFIALLIIVVLVTAGVTTLLQSEPSIKRSPSIRAFADPCSGKAPFTSSFSFEQIDAQAKITSALWDFGDGTSSAQHVTNNTYPLAGHYCVELTVWSGEVFVTETIDITVLDFPIPIVSISADNTCGKPPFTVSFTSNSDDTDGSIDRYLWDFGDGDTSSKQHPKHTYEEPGVYYVWHTVIDNDGQQNSARLQINVIENYPPVVTVSADITSGRAPLTVNFVSDCQDIDGDDLLYRWVFEDTLLPKNRESTLQNPSHTFWLPGIYDVRVYVTDEDRAMDTSTIRITVQESLFSWALQKGLTSLINRALPETGGPVLGLLIDRLVNVII